MKEKRKQAIITKNYNDSLAYHSLNGEIDSNHLDSGCAFPIFLLKTSFGGELFSIWGDVL